MKSNKDIFSRLRYGDFLLVGAVLLISLVLFFGSFTSEKLQAELYLDGERVSTVELYSLTGSETMTLGDCELLIEKDGVTFISSDCPDKLCVNRGKLQKAGDAMACVPERVSVVLKNAKGNEVDAVVF